MEHVYFSDGDNKKISWVIENKDAKTEQYRDHPDIYLDKVSTQQSKYIALHVGIFWCIGRFIIKNGDTVRIMIDSKQMFDHLSNNYTSPDSFIESKTGFIKQLITQRSLVVKYELINAQQNIATKLLLP